MKKYIHYIAFFLALGTSLFYARSYITVLTEGFENYIIAPTEFGQYVVESREYSEENINLIEKMEVGKEPGLFLLTSNLGRISNLRPEATLTIVSISIRFLIMLAIYLVSLRMNVSKTNGFITMLILSTILQISAASMFSWSRQALSHFFLVMTCLTWNKTHTSFKKNITTGIFLGMAIISHRVGLMFALLPLLVLTGKFLSSGNKSQLKKMFYIFIIVLISSGPYLFLQLGNMIITIYQFAWTAGGGTLDVEDNFSQYVDSSKVGGSDIFTGSGTISHTPIVHYFLQQPFIIIMAIANAKNILRRGSKKNLMLVTMFLIVGFYECFSLVFGTRILQTFETLLLCALTIGMLQKVGRIWATIFVINIFLIGILSLERFIVRPWVINIKNDPSIEFIKENISKSSVLIGHHWVNDVGNQLGYLTGNNIVNSPLYVPLSDILNGKYNYDTRTISYYEGRDMANIMGKSLAFQPEVYNIFQGKDMYLLVPWSLQKLILEKYKNQHYSSPYLTLIYQNKRQGYFSQIFKVNTEKLIYYEGYAYYHYLFIKKKW